MCERQKSTQKLTCLYFIIKHTGQIFTTLTETMRRICHTLSHLCHPFPCQVVPYGSDPGSMPTHDFKILFKEGGVGTFIPLFFNLLSALRAMNPPQPTSSEETSSVTTVSDDNSAVPPPRDQFSNVQPPVEDMLRHAYVYSALFLCIAYSLLAV